jgi:hypothetical protein
MSSNQWLGFNDLEMRVIASLLERGGNAKSWEIRGGHNAGTLRSLKQRGFLSTTYDPDSESNYWRVRPARTSSPAVELSALDDGWNGAWSMGAGRVLKSTTGSNVLMFDARPGRLWSWLLVEGGDQRSQPERDGTETDLLTLLLSFGVIWDWIVTTHLRALFLVAHSMRDLNGQIADAREEGRCDHDLVLAALVTEANLNRLLDQATEAFHSRARDEPRGEAPA